MTVCGRNAHRDDRFVLEFDHFDPMAGPYTAPAAMVDFPSSESSHSASASDVRYPRPLHLPFRRISSPSAPNLLQRQSFASTMSFESLMEDNTVGRAASPPANGSPVRAGRHRPASVELGRRARRRSLVRPTDERREAKRRKVVNEFYETERSYLDGLDLIYSHFLAPLLASLDTPQTLLDPKDLTAVFSNFIDIWNLHHSFYAALTTFIDQFSTTPLQDPPPPISPLLSAHFPYLSLYTPFVTSFPDALSTYNALLSINQAFAQFMAQRETDPRCGKLKFRDWMLTVVQRCPRYLLLLKDMIACTDPEDPEYQALTSVHALASKITSSLNTSLHMHAQTLSLLALQRNTSNLPFRLVHPGRSLLKRAPLLQLDGSTPRERDFLLFSDCLLWLANADGDELSAKWAPALSPSASFPAALADPRLPRSRSKSDADLPLAQDAVRRKESVLKFVVGGAASKKKVRYASHGAGDERWVYKGHVNLVDLEVVSPPREMGEESRFEIMSPMHSFAIYSGSEAERDEWTAAIRAAKASLLVSLTTMQSNSTLTSSSSTNHLRRSLQALPYSPDKQSSQPRRSHIEHFVPAIWIPDGKTQSCMRCGRTFGWRRRRHHCRLCGRCVCGSCSSKTFFILEAAEEDSPKAARACDACYDTVFPVLEPSPQPTMTASTSTTYSRLTLSGLQSMPSLVFADHSPSTPSALMSIHINSPKRHLSRIDDESTSDGTDSLRTPVRMKPPARPRSYVQILEDFHEHEAGCSPSHSPSASRYNYGRPPEDELIPDERDEDALDSLAGSSTDVAHSQPLTPVKEGVQENTARKQKRFSLPALALHTNPVTAQPNIGQGEGRRFSLVLNRNGTEESERTGLAAGKLSELLARMRVVA